MRVTAATLPAPTVIAVDVAQAIARYESLGQSYASPQKTVSRGRAAMLRNPSKRGNAVPHDHGMAGDDPCGTDDYTACMSLPIRGKSACLSTLADRLSSSIHIDAMVVFYRLRKRHIPDKPWPLRTFS